jgi:sugar phosphate isomerase/epimerase
MSDILALQLYTVRDETAKDFAGTIRRVAAIGYGGVEFAGYGGLSSKEMAALLADTNLRAVGTHVSLDALNQDLDGQINYCLDIGCPLLVVPYLAEDQRGAENARQLGERLNEIGRHARERGVTLGYHNHDFEFRAEDGGTFMDRLTAATDPALVKLELDTYWASYAGVDPIAFIRQHSGRIASLHLKDMTPERTFTEVGDGTLDISGFVEAGREAGAHTFIVENDAPRIPSLESARRSFEDLHRSLT